MFLGQLCTNQEKAVNLHFQCFNAIAQIFGTA